MQTQAYNLVELEPTLIDMPMTHAMTNLTTTLLVYIFMLHVVKKILESNVNITPCIRDIKLC
jgi:hypothetical protein